MKIASWKASTAIIHAYALYLTAEELDGSFTPAGERSFVFVPSPPSFLFLALLPMNVEDMQGVLFLFSSYRISSINPLRAPCRVHI